ncbi:hypothetical protein TSOC_015137, partial [Tetrabaena socialis]
AVVEAPAPAADGAAAAPTPAGPTAASIAASSAAEPYSREAKAFVEARVLNRDVKLVLEGVDKYGNLFGSVLYTPPPPLPGAAPPAPAAGADADAAAAAASAAPAAPAEEHLAEQLLKQGLAK